MAWYPILGWSVFWLGLIASIILFATKRKWHPVLALVTVCLYIFTVSFVIDVFQFKTNGVLLMLALSAGVMIFLGMRLSQR